MLNNDPHLVVLLTRHKPKTVPDLVINRVTMVIENVYQFSAPDADDKHWFQR